MRALLKTDVFGMEDGAIPHFHNVMKCVWVCVCSKALREGEPTTVRERERESASECEREMEKADSNANAICKIG